MPERKMHFSEAENNRYNVSNVLNVMNDGSSYRPKVEKPVESPEDAPVVEELEEGSLLDEEIDRKATIGDYMQRYEEENPQEAVEEETAEEVVDEAYESDLIINEEPDPTEVKEEQVEEVQEEIEVAEEVTDELQVEEEPYIYEAPETSVKSPVILEQAQKARDTFIDDLRSVDSEPALQRMKEREEMAEVEDDEAEKLAKEAAAKEKLEEVLASPARRIRKPCFIKPSVAVEEKAAAESVVEDDDDSIEEPFAPEDTFVPEDEESTADELDLKEEYSDDVYEEDDLDDALAEARAAQRNSICEDLHHFQQYLEEARSPMMHKTEVLVPREKTLRLIRSLTAICDVDPSYLDLASEDILIDRLAGEQGDGNYEPLRRARNRAQTIIQNATKQAETIISDAKVLASQLLTETEAEIKEKYDAADVQIAVRMDTAKEESSKKLNEARSELTTSRQRSVEILSKYLEKAEIDYQGYWERAENTVMASLEQSESILMKAAEIYRKELEVIRQDRDELSEILEHLKRYKPL